MKIKTSLTIAGLAMGSMLNAQERVCGVDYEIKSGDNLSKISALAFGDQAAFMKFYDDPRNAKTLGDNPNVIQVGQIIHMPPCDGEEKVAATTTRTINTTEDQIDLLTGSDFAPFTHEDLPEGGMLVKVVSEALDLSGLDNPSEVTFINDWGSHLETLLPKGAYDMGFPWYKPNCERKGLLSENMQLRCEYLWSEPLYSEAIAFYMPSILQDKPKTFEDFHNKKICRPDGYWTFDLEEKGLIDGQTIEMVMPSTVLECFRLLEQGKVDAVSLNRFTAEDGIAAAGLTGLVEPIADVVTTQTLHVVVRPENAQAVEWLKAFDQGLAKLQSNGRYQTIVKEYIELHEKRTQ